MKEMIHKTVNEVLHKEAWNKTTEHSVQILKRKKVLWNICNVFRKDRKLTTSYMY